MLHIYPLGVTDRPLVDQLEPDCHTINPYVPVKVSGVNIFTENMCLEKGWEAERKEEKMEREAEREKEWNADEWLQEWEAKWKREDEEWEERMAQNKKEREERDAELKRKLQELEAEQKKEQQKWQELQARFREYQAQLSDHAAFFATPVSTRVLLIFHLCNRRSQKLSLG